MTTSYIFTSERKDKSEEENRANWKELLNLLDSVNINYVELIGVFESVEEPSVYIREKSLGTYENLVSFLCKHFEQDCYLKIINSECYFKQDMLDSEEDSQGKFKMVKEKPTDRDYSFSPVTGNYSIIE